MYLYLVRHGQSEGNVLLTFHGWTDYPLTELGHQHARQSAEKLKDVPFTRCCASDLKRAWDTAGYCVEGRGVVRERCPDLREHYVGDIEGLSWEEMGEKYPQVRQDFLEKWFTSTPPGGENPRDMLQRVGRVVDEIVSRGEDTLIVSHYGTMRMILAHLGLIPMEELSSDKVVFLQGTYSVIKVSERGAQLLVLNR